VLTTLLAFAVTPLLLAQPQSQASFVTAGANDRAGSLSGEDSLPGGMVLIPAGETVLGTDADQVERLGQKNIQPMTDISAETPRHTVHVETFFIDTTEITNLQWQVYLDATGRKPSDDLVEYGWGTEEIPEGQEDFPVTGISLPEIEAFLEWCGKRLPTEPEWTRAARGDDDRTYPWGPKWNSKLLQSGSTVPQRINRVGSYPDGASPFGVHDLVGNVWEWVDSPYAPYDGFRPIEFKQGRKKILLTPEFNRTHKVGKGGCYISTRDTSTQPWASAPRARTRPVASRPSVRATVACCRRASPTSTCSTSRTCSPRRTRATTPTAA
jgi:formylglycine-generating enzyme required for sulfatase activity